MCKLKNFFNSGTTFNIHAHDRAFKAGAENDTGSPFYGKELCTKPLSTDVIIAETTSDSIINDTTILSIDDYIYSHATSPIIFAPTKTINFVNLPRMAETYTMGKLLEVLKPADTRTPGNGPECYYTTSCEINNLISVKTSDVTDFKWVTEYFNDIFEYSNSKITVPSPRIDYIQKDLLLNSQENTNSYEEVYNKLHGLDNQSTDEEVGSLTLKLSPVRLLAFKVVYFIKRYEYVASEDKFEDTSDENEENTIFILDVVGEHYYNYIIDKLKERKPKSKCNISTKSFQSILEAPIIGYMTELNEVTNSDDSHYIPKQTTYDQEYSELHEQSANYVKALNEVFNNFDDYISTGDIKSLNEKVQEYNSSVTNNNFFSKGNSYFARETHEFILYPKSEPTDEHSYPYFERISRYYDIITGDSFGDDELVFKEQMLTEYMHNHITTLGVNALTFMKVGNELPFKERSFIDRIGYYQPSIEVCFRPTDHITWENFNLIADILELGNAHRIRTSYPLTDADVLESALSLQENRYIALECILHNAATRTDNDPDDELTTDRITTNKELIVNYMAGYVPLFLYDPTQNGLRNDPLYSRKIDILRKLDSLANNPDIKKIISESLLEKIGKDNLADKVLQKYILYSKEMLIPEQNGTTVKSTQKTKNREGTCNTKPSAGMQGIMLSSRLNSVLYNSVNVYDKVKVPGGSKNSTLMENRALNAKANPDKGILNLNNESIQTTEFRNLVVSVNYLLLDAIEELYDNATRYGSAVELIELLYEQLGGDK